MSLNTKIKKTMSSIIPVLVTVAFMTGCAGEDPAGPDNSTFSGTADITVYAGKIGTLAKRYSIEMEKCIISIRIKESDSIVISDTSEISGTGETVITKTFTELTAPEAFILEVATFDTEEKVIHRGSTDFSTIPADTVDVAIDLDAKYSMLKVSFNDLPDSVTSVILCIDDVDTLDTSFSSGEMDTAIVEYDYLEADTEGIEHTVSLQASGSFYGTDTTLYAADTSIVAQSGVDTTYKIVLNWVGPDIPHGAAEITVTIGTIGITIINTGFGPITDHEDN